MNALTTNVRAERAVEPSPLMAAIQRAVLASDHVSLCLANGTEAECDAAEDAAWDARQNLIAEFAVLGVSADWARRIGGVL